MPLPCLCSLIAACTRIESKKIQLGATLAESDWKITRVSCDGITCFYCAIKIVTAQQTNNLLVRDTAADDRASLTSGSSLLGYL
jgi:hypothetical protein